MFFSCLKTTQNNCFTCRKVANSSCTIYSNSSLTAQSKPHTVLAQLQSQPRVSQICCKAFFSTWRISSTESFAILLEQDSKIVSEWSLNVLSGTRVWWNGVAESRDEVDEAQARWNWWQKCIPYHISFPGPECPEKGFLDSPTILLMQILRACKCTHNFNMGPINTSKDFATCL